MAPQTPAKEGAARKFARRAAVISAAASLAFCGACGIGAARGDAADADIPEIRSAAAFEQKGDLDKAIAEYEAAIRLHPDAASAHMSLGLLLHDYKHDYVGAIYHYRTYLALRPDTQKRTIIEDHLRQARQLLGADLAKSLVNSGDNAILIQQLQKEQQKVAALQSEKAALTAELEDVKGQLARATSERDHLQRRVAMLSATPLPSPVQQDGGSQITTPLSGDSDVNTYEVQKGDTLNSIAVRFYGDPNQWPRIKKANPDIKDDRIKPGMVLTIP